MKIGEIFNYDGKKFAYYGMSNGGAIQVVELDTYRRMQFRRRFGFADFEPRSTGEIDQGVVEMKQRDEEQKQKSLRLIQGLKPGDHFIGSDNKEYEFEKMNSTRFKFKDLNGIPYTGKPAFIKEVK